MARNKAGRTINSKTKENLLKPESLENHRFGPRSHDHIAFPATGSSQWSLLSSAWTVILGLS
jgi:hypothetical protein